MPSFLLHLYGMLQQFHVMGQHQVLVAKTHGPAHRHAAKGDDKQSEELQTDLEKNRNLIGENHIIIDQFQQSSNRERQNGKKHSPGRFILSENGQVQHTKCHKDQHRRQKNMEQVYAPGKGDKTGQLEKQREDNRRFQKIPEQPQRERVF